MTSADRWLLPDGVEEILPADAEHIEQLRRRLLNLYNSWGYDLVILVSISSAFLSALIAFSILIFSRKNIITVEYNEEI